MKTLYDALFGPECTLLRPKVANAVSQARHALASQDRTTLGPRSGDEPGYHEIRCDHMRGVAWFNWSAAIRMGIVVQ